MRSASNHPALRNAIPPTVRLRDVSHNADTPWLLDLFCGAGGACAGYMRAGFKVVGIDINSQPRYPGLFIQGNALDCDYEFLSHFDAIHASPPCQHYCNSNNDAHNRGVEYPDLIEPARSLLISSGLPYIMENLPQAPLRPDICLSGTMFGLGVIRRRVFETNTPIRKSDDMVDEREGMVITGDYVTVAGNGGGGGDRTILAWRRAMGISWMKRGEIQEAIPPAYTEFIGRELLSYVRGSRCSETLGAASHNLPGFSQIMRSRASEAS